MTISSINNITNKIRSNLKELPETEKLIGNILLKSLANKTFANEYWQYSNFSFLKQFLIFVCQVIILILVVQRYKI